MSKICVISDFAGTLTSKSLEIKAVGSCCRTYGLTPEEIAKIVSSREIPSSVSQSVIRGCFGIFKEAVESATILPEAVRALDWAAEKIGCDCLFISTNAEASWVEEALLRNRLNSNFQLILGRRDGKKEEHFLKISKTNEFKTFIFLGDNLQDFPQVGNGKALRIAIGVPPGEKRRFEDANIDIIHSGPLNTEVMMEAIEKAGKI